MIVRPQQFRVARGFETFNQLMFADFLDLQSDWKGFEKSAGIAWAQIFVEFGSPAQQVVVIRRVKGLGESLGGF